MAHVYRSGAFLQQCFSVHPLSLRVGKAAAPGAIGIVCTHCASRHHMTVSAITHIAGKARQRGGDAAGELAECAAMHRDALHVTHVSADWDIVQFRCRECKAGFHAAVSLCETRRP